MTEPITVPSLGQFVIIKKCTNCQAVNPPNRNSCHACSIKFIDEATIDDWANHNNELQRKRTEREQND